MTVVELCNNALAQMAHDRVITALNDGSAEAVRCTLFWPRARRAVLAAHPWKFLQQSATPVAHGTALAGFTHSYNVPATSLKITGAEIIATGEQLPFVMRDAHVHTRGVPTAIWYTADDETPDNWPVLVQDAVIADLADRLARVMTVNKTVIEMCAQASTAALAMAMNEDNNLPGVTQGKSVAIVDLCNNALAAAGAGRDIGSLTDGSREAALCTRLYPLVRVAILTAHPWAFAADSATPDAGSSSTVTGYTKVHAVPAGALAVTGAMDAAGGQLAFVVRGAQVHVAGTATKLIYTGDMTDPVAWPPAFKDAVIAEFAARLTRSMPGLAAQVEAADVLARRTFDAAVEAVARAAGVTQGESFAVLDLCNNALAAAGAKRDIASLADGSREAALCTRFLPLTRRSALAAHPWNFATRVTKLVPMPNGVVLAGYDGAYAAPVDALAVLSAVDEAGEPCAYLMREGVIYANGNPVTLTYTEDVPDAIDWPPLFRDAVIAELAARLARSLPGLDKKANGAAMVSIDASSRARRADVPSRKPGTRNPYAAARN